MRYCIYIFQSVVWGMLCVCNLWAQQSELDEDIALNRDVFPPLQQVFFYKENIAYMVGGDVNAVKDKGNFIIRYYQRPQPGDFKCGELSKGNYFLMAYTDDATPLMRKRNLGGASFYSSKKTNSFGAASRKNIMKSISLYPWELLKKYYPNLKDTVYGFVLSRAIHSNSNWKGDSYIYQIKDNITDALKVEEGEKGAKYDNDTFVIIQDGEGNKTPQTVNYSEDSITEVLAVDYNKAWAIGSSTIKVFNGKDWFDFSGKACSVTRDPVVPVASSPATAPKKMNIPNIEIAALKDLNGAKLKSLAGCFLNQGDQDTVFIAGEKGVLLRIIYTVCQPLDPVTSPGRGRMFQKCKTSAAFACPVVPTTPGMPISIDSFSIISIEKAIGVCSGGTSGSGGSGGGSSASMFGCFAGVTAEEFRNLNFTSVSVAGSSVFIVSSGGKNFVSRDGGASFMALNDISGTLAVFNSISCVDDKNCLVVGAKITQGERQVYNIYHLKCEGNEVTGCKWQRKDREGKDPVDLFSASFYYPDLGFIVGDFGAIRKIEPFFEISSGFENDEGDDTKLRVMKNLLPGNLYDNKAYLTPLVSLNTAEVIRCKRSVAEGCSSFNWEPDGNPDFRFYAGFRPPSLPGIDAGVCSGAIFPPAPSRGIAQLKDLSCPVLTGGRFEDVTVYAQVRSNTKWRLEKRPQNLEISLESIDKEKVPEVLKKEWLNTKKDNSAYEIGFLKQNATKTKFNAKESMAMKDRYLTYELKKPSTMPSVPAVTDPKYDKTEYSFAKSLDSFVNVFESGDFKGGVKVFNLKIRSLIPNFSLSPELTRLVFNVGESEVGVQKRCVYVVRPGLVPYMNAPDNTIGSIGGVADIVTGNGAVNETLAQQINGYRRAVDSFVLPTNTDYVIKPFYDELFTLSIDKLASKKLAGEMKKAGASYSSTIGNFSAAGKFLRDTPILRKWDKYDHSQSMHDRAQVHLQAVHNYINSADVFEMSIENQIKGPCYDKAMRGWWKFINGSVGLRTEHNYNRAITALMPAMGILKEGQVQDDIGQFIGSPLEATTDAERNNLEDYGRLQVGDITLAENLPCPLAALTERNSNLPVSRFPQIRNLKTTLRLRPFYYRFSYNSKGGIRMSASPLTIIKGVQRYNNRFNDFESLSFSASGAPLDNRDTLFHIWADTRYEYELQPGYIKSINVNNPDGTDRVFSFDEKYNKNRFHYQLMKSGRTACDDTITRKTSVAEGVLDSFKVHYYDTTSQKTDADKLFYGFAKNSFRLRLLKSNYYKETRIDTIVLALTGYDKPDIDGDALEVKERRIKLLTVSQKGAELKFAKKDGRPVAGDFVARAAPVRLKYFKDSLPASAEAEAVQYKKNRDSVWVGASVKWYIKTKKNGVPAAGAGATGTYGKGWGVWYDTLHVPHTVKANDITYKGTGCLAFEDDFPDGLEKNNFDFVGMPFLETRHSSEPPRIIFRAIKSNLDAVPREDSIEVCTLLDHVCKTVIIEQDTPKVAINYKAFPNPLRPDDNTLYFLHNKDENAQSAQAYHTRDSLTVTMADGGEWQIFDKGCTLHTSATDLTLKFFPVPAGMQSYEKPAPDVTADNLSGGDSVATIIPKETERKELAEKIQTQAKKTGTSDKSFVIETYLTEGVKRYATAPGRPDKVVFATTIKNMTDLPIVCKSEVCAVAWEDVPKNAATMPPPSDGYLKQRNTSNKYCQEIALTQAPAVVVLESVPKEGVLLPSGMDMAVDYYLNAPGALKIGADEPYDMKLPDFIEQVACTDRTQSVACAPKSSSSSSSSTDMKSPEMCKTTDGTYPVYDERTHCATNKGFKGAMYQYQANAANGGMTHYCFAVKNILENAAPRMGDIEISIAGTKPQLIRKLNVIQHPPYFRVTPDALLFGRRKGGEQSVRFETNMPWVGLYDVLNVGVRPNSEEVPEKRKQEGEIQVRTLQDNDNIEKKQTLLRLVPTDVCDAVKGNLGGVVRLEQEGFFLRLIPIKDKDPKYPEEIDKSVSRGAYDYLLPPVENDYLHFRVESNANWILTSALHGGSFSDKWKILEPKGGFSARDTGEILIKVNELFNFLDQRGDSLRLNLLDPKGVLYPFATIYYRQRAHNFGEDNVVLYPNPVLRELHIKSVNPNSFKRGYVFIYGLNGALIARRKFTNGLVDFDFGTLPVGVYLVRVFDGNQFVTKKIIRR